MALAAYVAADTAVAESVVAASSVVLRFMIYILHCLQDPTLWELWYIPYYRLCGIYIINP